MNKKDINENACSNCGYFHFYQPQHNQPYPEYACLKGHWDGISSEEDYKEIYEETDCKDYVKKM